VVKHCIPSNYKEALVKLNEEPYQLVAGGTDLMVQHRLWGGVPVDLMNHVLFLANLSELKSIQKQGKCLRIGAMMSLQDILNHPDTSSLLKKAIGEMASPGIRHIATLAGNIGNASPAGDGLVPLLLYDAFVVLESIDGTREVRIQDYIIGPRQTIRKQNELIREIVVPLKDFTNETFVKVGGRKADAISKVSFAGAARIEEGILKDIRFAFGAVYKTVVRSKEVEESLIGRTISELQTAIPTIKKKMDALIHPIDDQRSNKKYRRLVALNLLETFLKDLSL